MATEIATQEINRKPTSVNKNDIKVLDGLLERTESLPDVLHLRAAEPGYVFTDADKEFVMDTYSKLDDILKELAAFINIKFPGCERHVSAWNDVDFDIKIGNHKIVTTNREEIKRAWRKGIFDLTSLIKTLRHEAVLLADEKESEAFTQTVSVNVLPEPAKAKRSWLEIFSWIAAILGTLISLYTVLT